MMLGRSLMWLPTAAMSTLGVDDPADPAGATVTFDEFSALAKEVPTLIPPPAKTVVVLTWAHLATGTCGQREGLHGGAMIHADSGYNWCRRRSATVEIDNCFHRSVFISVRCNSKAPARVFALNPPWVAAVPGHWQRAGRGCGLPEFCVLRRVRRGLMQPVVSVRPH